MKKHIDKNISKNWRGKYNQIFFDNAKKFATDAIKTASKKQFKRQQKQRAI